MQKPRNNLHHQGVERKDKNEKKKRERERARGIKCRTEPMNVLIKLSPSFHVQGSFADVKKAERERKTTCKNNIRLQ
jgi:hypothetical protein